MHCRISIPLSPNQWQCDKCGWLTFKFKNLKFKTSLFSFFSCKSILKFFKFKYNFLYLFVWNVLFHWCLMFYLLHRTCIPTYRVFQRRNSKCLKYPPMSLSKKFFLVHPQAYTQLLINQYSVNVTLTTHQLSVTSVLESRSWAVHISDYLILVL